MYSYRAANLGASSPSAAVKRLQTALTQLADLAAQPALRPGKIDGFVGTATVAATSAALRFISPRLSSKKAVRVSVDALAVALPFVPNVETYLAARADEVASAINLAIATMPAGAAPPSTATPWWQTTAGRGGLLAVAGILTTVLVMKKYRTGPAAIARVA